jgi:hypothetical protein
VDGDGDVDILASSYWNNNVSVRLNDGSGNFSGTVKVEVGIEPYTVTAADVDGDGDLDILTANAGSDNVSVRLNDGKGTFSGTTNLAVNDYPVSVAAADVDGDGDLDILAANVAGYNVSVRLNDGKGSFSSATHLAVGEAPQRVVAADVDGDGDLDILTANADTHNVSVRLNKSLITVSDITKAAELEDVTVHFTEADFSDAFSGGSLSKVKITSIPDAAAGTLKIGTVALTLNQEINAEDLGDLTFEPATNYNGSASFNWNGSDGTTYAESDAAVDITLAPVNDAPGFTKGADQEVNEDAGTQTIAGWATVISRGPSNEAGQTIDFLVTNNNSSLFAAQPAIAGDGTLTIRRRLMPTALRL